MNEKFSVIGLGRFGYQVAIQLAQNGKEVLAIDSNEATIDSIRDHVTQAVCIRVTDELSLRTIGVDQVGTVIVSMGENLAQSILMTALLKKRLKIKRVIARAITEIHREILVLVGADEVVVPEREVGLHLADRLCFPGKDIVRVTPEFCVVTIIAPDRFVGKTIKDLPLRQQYGVRCIGIRRGDKVTIVDDAYLLNKGDLIVLAGDYENTERVALL